MTDLEAKDNLKLGFYLIETTCPLHHGALTIAQRVPSSGDPEDHASGVWLVPGVKGPVFDEEPVVRQVLLRIEVRETAG